jgi:ketosteroid isomerase-like protein
MSQENTEVVSRAIEHLNETGQPAWDLYDPELVWTTRADGPAHQTYRGLDGLRRGTESLREVWVQIHVEVSEMIDEGDIVVSVLRWDLRARSGAELEAVEAWVTWVRDGKITRIEQHGSRQEALDAAGLSPTRT